MRARLVVPIESMRGKFGEDYYTRVMYGKQIIQRCPRRPTRAQLEARRLYYLSKKENQSGKKSMSRIKVQNSPTIRRMPTYLHKLLKMRLEGKHHVSSTELAEYMNIEPIVVRKDIALTGIAGQRRVGYDVNELIRYIKNYLSWQKNITATLIGAGSLGTALLGYDDFSHYGLNIESVLIAMKTRSAKRSGAGRYMISPLWKTA